MNQTRKDNISIGVLRYYINHPEAKRYGKDNVMSRKSVAYKHGLEHRGKLSGDKNPARRKDVRIKIGKKLKGRIITDSWKEKIRQFRR